MTQILAVPGALLLMVLPGCWLVMWGPPARAWPLAARVSLALLLSPVVVAAEFYGLRAAGLPFEATTYILPLLNLPAGRPLWRSLRAQRIPAVGTLLLWVAVLILPAAYLWYWMHDPALRANWGHAWTHADIAYLIANGQFRLEDPQLAGVRLAYPWIGHVHETVISYLLGTSPNVAYLWANVGVLAGTIGVTAALTGELGGSRVARATSALWLGFGINFAVIAWWVLPPALFERLPRVWGDGRFSPWLRKFGVFEPTVFGIGLCAALLYVVSRPARGTSWLTASFAALLLLALGVAYPVLLPAGIGIVATRFVAFTYVPWVLARFRRESLPAVAVNAREAFRMVAVSSVALVLVALYLRMLTVDQGLVTQVGLSTLYESKEKAVAIVLVLFPLALGALLAVRQAARHPAEWVTLLGTAAVCASLNVVFDVRPDRNEYKYYFVAAAALAPLTALGFARLPDRFGRGGGVVVALLAFVLAAPAFYRIYTELEAASIPIAVQSDRFDFRLQNGDRYAAAFDAVRDRSPVNAVLLARRADIDLTTVSRRATLVPAAAGEVHGFGQQADHLLKWIRGYPARIVDDRRHKLFTVLDSGATAGARALAELSVELRRPLVLLVESSDSSLASWLPGRADARLIFEGHGVQVWIVSAPARAESR